MKKLIFFFLLSLLFTSPTYGQLNSLYNHLRAGDVLVKQQVEFVDPGEAGANKVWDFSKLKTVNDEYTLTYENPPLEADSVYIFGDKRISVKEVADNELIVGTEHYTMYYYRMINDSLIQYGHENPTTELEYTPPMLLMKFPLGYGQTSISPYKSNGLYSGRIKIATEGTITTTVDAFGKMLLPSGDSISPVIRVKTSQTIYDLLDEYSEENIDTNNGKMLETCRWYTKGYRYPVFETVRNYNLSDSSEIFSTAFFFPPQDHLYLDTDPDNLALLDEIWDLDNQQEYMEENVETITIEDILTCKIYPNPVESFLTLEYELKEDATITFDLYSVEGNPVKKIKPKKQSIGFYQEQIDCSSLYPRNYVLKITVNSLSFNQVIIKK